MLLVAEDSQNELKNFTEKNPDFLPAKLFLVKMDIINLRENGYNISSSGKPLCPIWEIAENDYIFIKSLIKIKSSPFFLSKKTYKNYFTENDMMYLNSWCNYREISLTFLIKDGIETKLKSTTYKNGGPGIFSTIEKTGEELVSMEVAEFNLFHLFSNI